MRVCILLQGTSTFRKSLRWPSTCLTRPDFSESLGGELSASALLLRCSHFGALSQDGRNAADPVRGAHWASCGGHRRNQNAAVLFVRRYGQHREPHGVDRGR